MADINVDDKLVWHNVTGLTKAETAMADKIKTMQKELGDTKKALEASIKPRVDKYAKENFGEDDPRTALLSTRYDDVKVAFAKPNQLNRKSKSATVEAVDLA